VKIISATSSRAIGSGGGSAIGSLPSARALAGESKDLS
jgi:hypothetical protein